MVLDWRLPHDRLNQFFRFVVRFRDGRFVLREVIEFFLVALDVHLIFPSLFIFIYLLYIFINISILSLSLSLSRRSLSISPRGRALT